MSYDIEMKIFGRITDAEAVYDLAEAASSEGKIDYLFDITRDEFVNMLEAAEGQSGPVTITARSYEFFEQVSEACRAAGLSYVMRAGETGAENYSEGFAWRPGMDDAARFLIDGKELALPVSEIRKAASRGVEGVSALLAFTTDVAEIGRIEIEPGFREAYDALANQPKRGTGPSFG